MPISRKSKSDKAVEPTEEQKEFEKKHRFTPPVKDTIKEDSQFNNAGPDGLYSTEPKQKSNIGIYQCCMEQNHKYDPTHYKDESTGITRFWCKICGWDLTLKQSDTYMIERMKQ